MVDVVDIEVYVHRRTLDTCVICMQGFSIYRFISPGSDGGFCGFLMGVLSLLESRNFILDLG